jgi:BlaI family penicillinase repressor
VSQINPTERELEALKVLWDRCEATVRDIADTINAAAASARDKLAYTTVLSLLQVMEQKGLVDHRRDGKAYVYFPLVERQSTFRQLAGNFLDKVFDGALAEYLVHALESRRMSDAELAELESMLAETRKKKSKQGRKGGRK